MEYGDSRLRVAAGIAWRFSLYFGFSAAIFLVAWRTGSILLGSGLVLFVYTCWAGERHQNRGRKYLRERYAGTKAEETLKNERNIKKLRITETPWGWLYESEAVEKAAKKHTDKKPLFPSDPY